MAPWAVNSCGPYELLRAPDEALLLPSVPVQAQQALVGPLRLERAAPARCTHDRVEWWRHLQCQM